VDHNSLLIKGFYCGEWTNRQHKNKPTYHPLSTTNDDKLNTLLSPKLGTK